MFSTAHMVALALVSLCFTASGVAGDSRVAPGSTGVEVLDSWRVKALELKALDGDKDAALAVAWHYDYTGTVEESLKWTTIAAENGAETAMVNLAISLAYNRPTPESCRRAMFWLKRVLVVGRKSEADRLNVRQRIRSMSPELETCMHRSKTP